MFTKVTGSWPPAQEEPVYYFVTELLEGGDSGIVTRWEVARWSMVKFSCATRRFYLFVGQIEIIGFFLPLNFTFCWVKSSFWCGKQQLLLLNKSKEIQDLVAQYPHIFPPSFRLANSIFAHWIHYFCWFNLIIVKFIDEHSISIFSPMGFGANPKKHAGEIPLLDAKSHCGGVCFHLFSLFSQSNIENWIFSN